MVVDGAVTVDCDNVQSNMAMESEHYKEIIDAAWGVCNGYGTAYFEGGLEAGQIYSFVEYTEHDENLGDWLSVD